MRMLSKKKRMGKRKDTNMDVLIKRRMNKVKKLSLLLKMMKKVILIAMNKRITEAKENQVEVEVRKDARVMPNEERDVKESRLERYSGDEPNRC